MMNIASLRGMSPKDTSASPGPKKQVEHRNWKAYQGLGGTVRWSQGDEHHHGTSMSPKKREFSRPKVVSRANERSSNVHNDHGNHGWSGHSGQSGQSGRPGVSDGSGQSGHLGELGHLFNVGA